MWLPLYLSWLETCVNQMHILDLPDDIFQDIFSILDFEPFDIRIKSLKAIRL
jgi:hypothetical protein